MQTADPVLIASGKNNFTQHVPSAATCCTEDHLDCMLRDHHVTCADLPQFQALVSTTLPPSW
jgi:hypothetical protein